MDESNGLKDRITHAAETIPQATPRYDDVFRRSRRLRNRQRFFVWSVAILALAGSLVPLWLILGPLSARHDRSPETGSTGAGGWPRTATIECTGALTRVLTSAVQPRLDGVHVAVVNESSHEVQVVGVFGDRRVQDSAPPGRSVRVWSVPPGVGSVRCTSGDPNPQDQSAQLASVRLALAGDAAPLRPRVRRRGPVLDGIPENMVAVIAWAASTPRRRATSAVTSSNASANGSRRIDPDEQAIFSERGLPGSMKHGPDRTRQMGADGAPCAYGSEGLGVRIPPGAQEWQIRAVELPYRFSSAARTGRVSGRLPRDPNIGE